LDRLFGLHVRANGFVLGCGLDCNLGSRQTNVNVSSCSFRQPGPGQLKFTLVIAAGYGKMILCRRCTGQSKRIVGEVDHEKTATYQHEIWKSLENVPEIYTIHAEQQLCITDSPVQSVILTSKECHPSERAVGSRAPLCDRIVGCISIHLALDQEGSPEFGVTQHLSYQHCCGV
jgi:hypothetical protein